MTDTEAVKARLRDDLRHRLRPMTGRDPLERDRSSTPLELFYDLTYVVAFGTAAAQLAHYVIDGKVAPAIGAFTFAIWAVSWAWMNFTWFASAYDNDDALFRIATIVQMIGVVILSLGLPVSFEATAEGHSPNNALMVVGYVIMRVPLIGLWLRAAREDPSHRRTAVAYAVIVAVAQAGWVLITVVHLPLTITVVLLVAWALAEMAAPVVAERRLGPVPWNAGHIAERFALLAIICLGEVVAATTGAVSTLAGAEGWSVAAAVIAASGLLLAAGLWWAYFLIPSRTILEEWPGRTLAWRYAHLPMFGAIVAVGSGLEVAAAAVEQHQLSLPTVSLALVIPVGAVLFTIFATWSVLMRSYDLTHVPLFLASLVPLAGAVAVGFAAGHEGAGPSGATAALVAVIALVMLAAVIEVVGHEKVGYPHTLRVVEATAADR